MIRSSRYTVIPDIMQVRYHAPKSAAAVAVPWYSLATGCVAAFSPWGAADYAAAKSNLITPGTHDATDVNAPGWNATDGMQPSANNCWALDIAPDGNYSAIMYSTDWAAGSLGWFGQTVAGWGGWWSAYGETGVNIRTVFGETVSDSGSAGSSGVIIMTPQGSYYNGTFFGAPANVTAAVQTIWIGIVRGGGAGTKNVKRFALYNGDIAAQVAALTTAIAIL